MVNVKLISKNTLAVRTKPVLGGVHFQYVIRRVCAGCLALASHVATGCGAGVQAGMVKVGVIPATLARDYLLAVQLAVLLIVLAFTGFASAGIGALVHRPTLAVDFEPSIVAGVFLLAVDTAIFRFLDAQFVGVRITIGAVNCLLVGFVRGAVLTLTHFANCAERVISAAFAIEVFGRSRAWLTTFGARLHMPIIAGGA